MNPGVPILLVQCRPQIHQPTSLLTGRFSDSGFSGAGHFWEIGTPLSPAKRRGLGVRDSRQASELQDCRLPELPHRLRRERGPFRSASEGTEGTTRRASLCASGGWYVWLVLPSFLFVFFFFWGGGWGAGVLVRLVGAFFLSFFFFGGGVGRGGGLGCQKSWDFLSRARKRKSKRGDDDTQDLLPS